VAVRVAQVERIHVALGVVEILSRLRIDAADGPHHLRTEDDVLDRDDLSKSSMPGR